MGVRIVPVGLIYEDKQRGMLTLALTPLAAVGLFANAFPTALVYAGGAVRCLP